MRRYEAHGMPSPEPLFGFGGDEPPPRRKFPAHEYRRNYITGAVEVTIVEGGLQTARWEGNSRTGPIVYSPSPPSDIFRALVDDIRSRN
jgi:hypothetical protein